MARIKRIIVGESGGPTSVVDCEVAGILSAAENKVRVYGAMNGLEGILHADVEGNIVDLTNVDPARFIHSGPGASLKTTRIKPNEEQYRQIVENLERLGIDGIVYIGGNDSADQLLGLTKINPHLAAIHAIKTVDNDLMVTHHCPGYGSAALFNAIAIKNVANDFSGYGVTGHIDKDKTGLLIAPIIIYQVMGRKAGWLAQATAFARVNREGEMVEGRSPHIILCKEVPFDADEYLGVVEDIIMKHGYAVVVVQEYLTDIATGKSLSELYSKDTRDAYGNIEHGRATSFSTAIYIARLTQNRLKIDGVKTIKELALVPQHIQRSFCVSERDVEEAFLVGYYAVKALLNGESRKAVILAKDSDGRFTTGLTDLGNIAGKVRQVPLEHIVGIRGPTQGFVNEYICVIGGAGVIPQYSEIPHKPVRMR